MSDEKNDELMTQFIEKATPKLLEALTEQVAKQVEAQISGLKENSEKLLDQLKTARQERDARDKQQAEDFNQLKTLLERGDTPKAVHNALTPESIKLTREQARDPQLYRRAKAQAEANGTAVQIIADAS